MGPREILRELFDAGLGAVDPARCVPPALPQAGEGRLVVVGAGKAAAAMARAVEATWPGELEGLVVTRYGHGVPCRHIEVVEAAHPVPDAAGAEAARRILERVSRCGAGERVLFLASGGGSALLAAPMAGLARRSGHSRPSSCGAAPTSTRSIVCASISRPSRAGAWPWPPGRRRCSPWPFPTCRGTLRR